MSSPSARSRDTILLVDDEREILIALEDLFDRDYRVLTATSPFDALALIDREPDIAVIVSDQRMPGMTGDVFLGEARNRSSAEAVLLTGYADLRAVINAVNLGRIVGYQPKPWEPAALMSMVAGAAARYRLARELDFERSLLRGLLDNTADAIAFKDRDGRFVRLNRRKAEALGSTVEGCLGHKESAFVDAGRADTIAAADAAVLTGGEPSELQIEETGSDGATRTRLATRIAIRDADGRIVQLATIERDVTEQKRLEERLRQADKMQALGTLAGGVAHDFNNLLTAILGSLDLASRHVTGQPRLEKLLQGAMMAGRRGAALTERLLSFTRKRELKLQAVDLNTVIDEMDELLVRTLGGLVTVEHHPAADLWPAHVDPDQFQLAVLNLCINARDAMADGGRVVVSTRNAPVAGEAIPELAPGDYVMITIADDGIGMSPEVSSRAFEPFFTTKDVGKGTGLGLSMVYGLVQQSGGAVTIDSAPGEGTRVTLYLPRADPAEPTIQALPPAGSASATIARILLVDDDPSVRDTTAGLLQDLGHDPIECSSGASALDMLRQGEAADLLIADFAMPGMNGQELADQVRQLRPSLPILLVTGYADLHAVPERFPLLRKPFQQSELAARIQQLLARA